MIVIIYFKAASLKLRENLMFHFFEAFKKK